MDAFNAANRFAETLFTLVAGGALGSAQWRADTRTSQSPPLAASQGRPAAAVQVINRPMCILRGEAEDASLTAEQAIPLGR